MKKKGDKWEIIAVEHLLKEGYKIKHTNFKFSRAWEIDIVAQIWALFVFIEVKYRKDDNYGLWVESITHAKKRKLLKTIQFYCRRFWINDQNIRFDVISVVGMNPSNIEHFENVPLEEN